MRRAFEGGIEERRAAFRALLGDRGRMRVLEDAERDFRSRASSSYPSKRQTPETSVAPGVCTYR
jgi:hypothetical protein